MCLLQIMNSVRWEGNFGVLLTVFPQELTEVTTKYFYTKELRSHKRKIQMADKHMRIKKSASL